MRRREFIAGLGTAAAFPLAAQAQQPRLPVIGHLGPTTKDASSEVSAAVGRGLAATGFVEGQNLAIEHRWADYHYDRLPALADDLVRRQVAVIYAATMPAVLAAKAATKSIPIVFVALRVF